MVSEESGFWVFLEGSIATISCFYIGAATIEYSRIRDYFVIVQVR